jgi:hypothetical protein
MKFHADLEYELWVSKRNVVHPGNMTLKVLLCKKSLHLERLFGIRSWLNQGSSLSRQT